MRQVARFMFDHLGGALNFANFNLNTAKPGWNTAERSAMLELLSATLESGSAMPTSMPDLYGRRRIYTALKSILSCTLPLEIVVAMVVPSRL